MKAIPYPLQFPLTDAMIISEFDTHESACGNQESSTCSENGINETGLQSGIAQESIALVHETSRPFNVHSLPSTLPSLGARPLAKKVSRVAQYILQKVVSRKPVGFQPNPKKVPNYILCYVEETLECGHTLTVYPSEIETLTARKRSCHECSGFFGGLKLSDLKKPAQKAWDETKRKMSGKGNGWAIPFAVAVCVFGAYIIKYGELKTAAHLRVLHNVRVLSRMDDYNFRLSAYDPYSSTWVPFSLTACKTFKPTQEIQAGVTLTLLQYEQQEKGCVDFTLLSNGYTLLRGEHNEPILTDPRSSAWATVSRPAAETTSTTPGTGTETARRPVAEGVSK